MGLFNPTSLIKTFNRLLKLNALPHSKLLCIGCFYCLRIISEIHLLLPVICFKVCCLNEEQPLIKSAFNELRSCFELVGPLQITTPHCFHLVFNDEMANKQYNSQ